MDLKGRIKQLCKEKGVSMNQLETELEFGKGYISKLDKSTPNVNKIQKISDYFGVTIGYLMGSIEEEKTADIMISIMENKELQDLVEAFKPLSDKSKKRLMKYIELLKDEEKEDA